MDRLDVRILREVMQGDPMETFFPARPDIKPAFRVLGQKLGVSESTARERFQKLSGFLSGVTLMANPLLFHERIAGLEVLVSDETPKDEVLDKLRLVQGVFQISDQSGSRAGIVFTFPDEATLRRTTDLIHRIAGSDDSAPSLLPLPKCDIRPSRLDYRIILSRQEDITRSNQAIADQLGVSSRTVKRRFSKLVGAGAVLPHFLINVDALEGGVYAKLRVEYRDPASRPETERAILSALDEYIFFTGQWADFTIFNLILPNIPRARNILNQVRRLNGVELARIGFVERIIDSPHLTRDKVRYQLARMEPAG